MQEREIQNHNLDTSTASFFEKQQTPQKSCLIHAGIGGIAGLLMEGFLHPIDTVRTRIKANVKESVPLLTQIKKMHRKEGVRSYFRGFSCTLSGSFVMNASYFFMYEKLKHFFHARQIFSRDSAPFFAAFLGGFLSNVIYLPFDVVRTRMQLKPGHYDYRHFWDGARKVLKYEGFRKLYLGGSVFLTLNALEVSLTFGFYELFSRLLEPLFPTTLDVNVPLSVVSSVLAASVAGFCVNPLDVLVTRIQSVNTKVHGSSSVLSMTQKILHNEGIGGFFKGVSGTMSYYAMGALILFPTYEILKGVCHVDLSN